MGEQLYSGGMYHPRGGMNIDSNGPSMKMDEAVDAVNVDITTSDVMARKGTTLLGEIDSPVVVSASGDPQLDGTYIIHPNYTGLYVGPAQGNVSVTPYIHEDDLEAISPRIITVTPTPDAETNFFWRLSGPFGGADGEAENTSMILAIPDTGWVNALSPTYDPVSTFTITRAQPSSTIIEYHSYNHPTEGKILFAFTINNIYRYVDGTGWVSVVGSLSFTNLDQWSITNFIDRKVGATVVAAGSEYTRPSEAYLEGATRVLLYYDPVANEFKDIQMLTEDYVDEDLGTLNIPMPSPYIETGTVAVTPIITGTLYFVVDGVGVIATAGTQIHINESTGEEYNLLIPVDDVVLFGVNSFIEINTGVYSIEFTTNTHNGAVYVALYTTTREVSYRPLYVHNFHNNLVMANTSELLDSVWHYFPWRVRVTIAQRMDLVLEADFQELALDDITPILGMSSLETVASSTLVGPLYFYKHNSIIRGLYNQNYKLNLQAPVPFLTFEIAYSEGIEAARTIVSVEGRQIYLGRNDVYMFDGANRISLTQDRDNGNTRVQKYIFDNLDLDSLNDCFAVYDDIARQYILFLKFSISSEYAETALVYDIDLRTWRRYITPPTSAGISVDLVPDGSIASLKGRIQDLSGRIEDLTGNLAKLLLFAQTSESYYSGNTSGMDRVGAYNNPYDSYFITRDFFGESLEEHDRVCRVYVEGKFGSMDLGLNYDYGLSISQFIQPATLSFPTKYRRETYNPDATAIHSRFCVKLLNNSIFRWMQVFSKRQEFTND